MTFYDTTPARLGYGKEPIRIVCKHCGSDDVRRDAWADWNPDTQQWELGEVFDYGHCNHCDDESSLVEIPIGAQEKPAQIDTGEGLELLTDGEGYWVRFEGDITGGNSLAYASQEWTVYRTIDGDHDLTEAQGRQVEEWFNEHED